MAFPFSFFFFARLTHSLPTGCSSASSWCAMASKYMCLMKAVLAQSRGQRPRQFWLMSLFQSLLIFAFYFLLLSCCVCFFLFCFYFIISFKKYYFFLCCTFSHLEGWTSTGELWNSFLQPALPLARWGFSRLSGSRGAIGIPESAHWRWLPWLSERWSLCPHCVKRDLEM